MVQKKSDLGLTKHPKHPIIIHGFPGFGLVGTITTEFLIQHLKCELIGKKWFEDLPSAVAIHKGELVQPVGLYYNKKYNIIIVHSISGSQGIEWKIADYLNQLGEELDAQEFLALEGVGTMEEKETPDIFYYTSEKERAQYFEDKVGLKRLNEGVVMGVTSALMLKTEKKMSAFFVETHADFPDSKASAELIQALDKSFDLNIDPKPLYESAKKFEENFNKILDQSQVTKKVTKKKQMSYVG